MPVRVRLTFPQIRSSSFRRIRPLSLKSGNCTGESVSLLYISRNLYPCLLAGRKALQVGWGKRPRRHRHDYGSRLPCGTRDVRRQFPCVIFEVCVVHISVLKDEGPLSRLVMHEMHGPFHCFQRQVDQPVCKAERCIISYFVMSLE